MTPTQIEVKAKTLHEAIEDACEQLGVSQDELTIDVLSQGGMFGKVKILATVKEKEVPPTIDIRPSTKGNIEPTVAEVKPMEKTEPVKKPRKEPASDNKTIEKASKKSEKPLLAKSTSTKDKFTATTDFVVKLLEILENDSTVTTEHTDAAFNINVNGEHIGRLIGKSGAVLNAIQTIVSSIAISNANGEGKRVFVNIGDYKEKRGDSLQSLAMKKAEYVKRTGRFVKLEPMNARDRAIIHTALSEVEGIKTYSTGRDPFRCLCISPADNN